MKCLRLVMIFSFLLLITACSQAPLKGHIEKVGLLVPDTINDQVWGTKGYKGLLNIQSTFGVDVYYKEGMVDQEKIVDAIEEFHQKGVNLIIGHGNEYSDIFNLISEDYPMTQFITVNGGKPQADNVTNVTFKGEAMGFFGGMTSAHMSKTKKIGILATYNWQSEVDGFIKGAKYQDANVQVLAEFVENWDDADKAVELYHKLKKQGADVVYPAGDGYNIPVIEQIKADQLSAIGYVTDQSNIGSHTVLTSTVQHVDKAYSIIAKKFNEGTLDEQREYSFDFKEGVVEMGKFSRTIDQSFLKDIENDIQHYKKTGKLPNEK
ncbi:BMP family ABC transporter substrate-binding protein [Bacillus sp. 179-C3.3 HS]|uniref:BMP family ABC transporter substrate-binding protein n=1 Tax=Bacillus sp. 179-C3.3 HS TaxID=3232162 RepID=UPI0039A21E1E